jgi:hypothetical protein
MRIRSSAVGLPQHHDEYRSEGPVLLAVDQEFGERPGLGVPLVGADRIDPVEVRQHEDMEELGAGSGTERVEALPKSQLELIGSHGRRLRRRTVTRVLACLSIYIREPWRTTAGCIQDDGRSCRIVPSRRRRR